MANTEQHVQGNLVQEMSNSAPIVNQNSNNQQTDQNLGSKRKRPSSSAFSIENLVSTKKECPSLEPNMLSNGELQTKHNKTAVNHATLFNSASSSGNNNFTSPSVPTPLPGHHFMTYRPPFPMPMFFPNPNFSHIVQQSGECKSDVNGASDMTQPKAGTSAQILQGGSLPFSFPLNSPPMTNIQSSPSGLWSMGQASSQLLSTGGITNDDENSDTPAEEANDSRSESESEADKSDCDDQPDDVSEQNSIPPGIDLSSLTYPPNGVGNLFQTLAGRQLFNNLGAFNGLNIPSGSSANNGTAGIAPQLLLSSTTPQHSGGQPEKSQSQALVGPALTKPENLSHNANEKNASKMLSVPNIRENGTGKSVTGSKEPSSSLASTTGPPSTASMSITVGPPAPPCMRLAPSGLPLPPGASNGPNGSNGLFPAAAYASMLCGGLPFSPQELAVQGYDPRLSWLYPYLQRPTQKRKGGQIRFTNEQTLALEKKFHKQKYLSPQERKKMAKSLQLSERQVKTWFQNRRAKWRRLKTDQDEDELPPGSEAHSHHTTSTSESTNDAHAASMSHGSFMNHSVGPGDGRPGFSGGVGFSLTNALSTHNPLLTSHLTHMVSNGGVSNTVIPAYFPTINCPSE